MDTRKEAIFKLYDLRGELLDTAAIAALNERPFYLQAELDEINEQIKLIESVTLEYQAIYFKKSVPFTESEDYRDFVLTQLVDDPTNDFYMLEAARLGLDTGEPSQDEITDALSDVDMDTPARARLTFREVCETLDGTDKPADWMLRAYRDMQTLTAPVVVPAYFGLVQYV